MGLSIGANRYFLEVMKIDLKKMREAAGLTQTQLADLVGLSQSYYATMERGEAPISLKKLELFAQALKCSIPEIIGFPSYGNHIPLVDWVSAGGFKDLITSQIEGDTVLFNGNAEGKFATRVAGNSMNKVAPDGSIIIVDINRRELIDGKLYIFGNDVTGENTFKMFKNEPKRLEPCSYDDSYKPMRMDRINDDEKWSVKGQVIEVRNNWL